MIFKRRDRRPVIDRLRELFYPRKGFWRGFTYVGQRMKRLPDSPHRIALGFACGAFASFSPFFTLHFILAALCAWIIRGNMVAALFGTIIGNPLSFPAIATSSVWIGQTILGRASDGGTFEEIMAAFGDGFTALWNSVKSVVGAGEADLVGLGRFLDALFLPYAIGGAILGLIAAFVTYWVLGPLVTAYQERRQRRFDRRVAEMKRAAEHEQAAYAAQDGKGGDNA